ncbi:MAG: helix-turn-helix transcriptional regulator [Microcoleus sp. SIO2G3]|nr:helix-turn-helix transcriptional regulator [Microcoleus sp. SIO2G3]
MPSLVVDFVKEKEEGYKRIFSRSPLLSSVSTQWDGILVAYDYLEPGQTPEISVKQHGIGIFVEMPKPAQAERLIDGQFRREQVLQGDVVIVPADTWHRTSWNRAGGAIVLGLEPKEFARTIEETIERDRIELIPHFATPDPLVHQIGLALKRALENSGSNNRLYAETMTTALMVHLLQYYSAKQVTLPIYEGGLSKLKLQRIVDYIHAHLDHDLSLKELAAIVQMSAHYFSQLFKQSTGTTPHQYVIRCRIERAKELLMQGKLTISDVAKVVGFVDQSHFHRHFKRLVGITPKAFLQQVKS